MTVEGATRGRRRTGETDADLRARLADQYPSLAQGAWARAMTNPNFHASMMGELVKVAVPQPEDARRGRRQLPDATSIANVIGDLTGDYAMVPFTTAVTDLVGTQSVRGIAARTGLDRNTVHRLTRGDRDPTVTEMEAIANGYHRSPLYFLEYRLAALLTMLAANLTPERSAAIVDKMRRPT